MDGPLPADRGPAALINLLANDQIRHSREWHDESVRLWDLAVDGLKSAAQTEARARYDDKKREILERVYRQFAELMRTCGREIDAYVLTLPPDKQARVAILREQCLKAPRKRGPKMVWTLSEPSQTAADDLREILSEVAASGVDPAGIILFGDGCFLYGGRLYCVGNTIQVESRNPGHCAWATVAAVTIAEIELSFREHTVMTIALEQLESKRVVFLPAE
jgi:hypothetical protein